MCKVIVGGEQGPPVPPVPCSPRALGEGPLLLPPPSYMGCTYASPRKRLGQTSLMWLSVAARRTHSKRCSEDSVGGW